MSGKVFGFQDEITLQVTPSTIIELQRRTIKLPKDLWPVKVRPGHPLVQFTWDLGEHGVVDMRFYQRRKKGESVGKIFARLHHAPSGAVAWYDAYTKAAPTPRSIQ